MQQEMPFATLIHQAQAGDEEAAAELVRRYEPAIRRVARVRLADPRLRRLLDSADVCQSVFGSFFVRLALGQYELHTPEELLRLLLAMSRRKLIDHVRKERAARRDYRRLEEGGLARAAALAAGPSPTQELATRELIPEFRKRLAPDERSLAEQRAAGRTWAEIAAERGASPEALRKRLARAASRVADELGLDWFHHD